MMQQLNLDFSLVNAIRTPSLKAIEELRQLYAQLDLDIAAQKPVCQTSGRCCQFEIWGHRLYISTLELAYFLHWTIRMPGTPDETPGHHGTIDFPLPLYKENGDFAPGCPWQINTLCTAREGRPLGCRIYFCDTTTSDWQTERYEYYHHKICDLHRHFEIPYRYMEWRSALAAIRPE